MKRVLGGILLGLVLAGVVPLLILAVGGFNTAATAGPTRLERKLALFTVNRSVARRAPEETNPFGSSPEALREALPHYRENCVLCHGAPGVEAAELARGLNPPPPDLTAPRIQGRSDGDLFWLVSEGIRMSGMPAFSPTHSREEIWKLVALIRHLPSLTAEERQLLEKSGEKGHHHESKDRPGGAGHDGR